MPEPGPGIASRPGSEADRDEPGVLGRWSPPEQVMERGRALRDAVRPEAHGHVSLAPDRPHILACVEEGNEGRLPELVHFRVSRMLSSPFSLFRGTAGLMAADLAAGPRSGLDAQLCGDAHAGNFGLYGTSDGRIVMDVNDFDETESGPWEWDLKRLAVSLILAGREGGASEKACREAAEDAVRSYRTTSRHLAELPFLESWTALGDESVLSRVKADALMDDFASAAKKARKNTSARTAKKWTRKVGESWRFAADPPLLSEVSAETATQVLEALPAYAATLRESRRHLLARFSLSDVAFRVVGTGSAGFRNYLVLLRGNGDEALILQVKQARVSALSGPLGRPPAKHEGKRIVHGARLVQAETDLFLGWTTIEGRPFIVRQFRNLQGEIDATGLDGDHLDDYGRLAGALLARAHTRSIDPRLLSGYCGDDESLDRSFGAYAVGYADRVEADHRDLVKALHSA